MSTKLRSLALAALLLLAQLGFVWAQPWQARHGLTSSQYQATFNDLVDKGYRLVDVSGCSKNGQARYAALWEKKSGPPWAARHGLTSAQYQEAFDDYVNRGYRLVHVSGYNVNGSDRYAAIWEESTSSDDSVWVAHHRMTSAQYQSYFDQYHDAGYRLVTVSRYSSIDDNQARYAAIWEKTNSNRPAYIARHGLSSSAYQGAFDTYVARGYRLVHVSAYNVAGTDQFAAIWEESNSSTPWIARHGLTGSQYQSEFDNLCNQGYRLENISCYTGNNGDPLYAAIWEGVVGTKVVECGDDADDADDGSCTLPWWLLLPLFCFGQLYGRQ